jgi:hypothetical protein
VGEYTGVTFALGVALGAAAGVGFAVSLAAGLVSAQGGGGARDVNGFEHAAETPKRIAMIERLLIGGLLWSGL